MTRAMGEAMIQAIPMNLRMSASMLLVTECGRVLTTVERAFGNPSIKVKIAPPKIDSLTDHHFDQSFASSTSFILIDL
jgi:hypothetical protein